MLGYALRHPRRDPLAWARPKNRLETQIAFVKEVGRLLTAGLGMMVDADMTLKAARLRVLQIQQQRAVQSLSIVNNAPQNLLALFT